MSTTPLVQRDGQCSLAALNHSCLFSFRTLQFICGGKHSESCRRSYLVVYCVLFNFSLFPDQRGKVRLFILVRNPLTNTYMHLCIWNFSIILVTILHFQESVRCQRGIVQSHGTLIQLVILCMSCFLWLCIFDHRY